MGGCYHRSVIKSCYFCNLSATLRELKLLLSFLDGLVLCSGNRDAKYEVLIEKRRGIFMDHSGKYGQCGHFVYPAEKNRIAFYDEKRKTILQKIVV